MRRVCHYLPMEVFILIAVVLNLLVLYFVIRIAVKHAMRDSRYEEYLEKNRPERAKWAPYVQGPAKP